MMFLAISHTLDVFTSDSVFEDEAGEMPPTSAQSAEDGDKPENSPAQLVEAEEEVKEQQPAQTHGETGQDLLPFSSFVLVGSGDMKMSAWASPVGGGHLEHPVPEQVASTEVRTETQQMNGIVEDRTSVSSTDMLVKC